jgi:hypothetical protein
MTNENISSTITISAPAETVFDVLADPSTHEAIDGTGWVRESLDGKPLTETGQIFRMCMYHDNHPDKYYEWPTGWSCSIRHAPSRGSQARAPTTQLLISADGSGDMTCHP